MHGSFTPNSAEKFLQLMAEAGYETRESPQGERLENFSSSLNRQVDTWATAAENFSETRGEYIDNYDYTRCVRPDGSSYGTGGKCRKGTETAKKIEPESTVKKEKYSWGSLVKVSKGNEYRAILHPEHQDQIRKLTDGESTKFKDEQGMHWTALRKGDTIHLEGGDRSYGNKPYKLSFNRSHLDGSEKTKPASPKSSKPRATEENVHSLMKKYGALDRRIESETKRLGKMLKGKKYEGLRKEVEERIKKLKAARKKIAENREAFNKQLDEETRRTGTAPKLMPDNWSPGYSEAENYDFTRCVRPDGSSYGSRGKCRKGTETTKPSEQDSKSRKYGDWGDAELRSHANELLNKVDPEKLSDKSRKAFDSQIKDIMSELRGRGLLGKAKAGAPSSGSKTKASKLTKELTPDEKWMQDRLATLRTLKGKSKQELLSILNQHRRIHGLTEKDSVRDLQGAILGSIHGNDSPTDIKQKRAARLAQIQGKREAQKGREEEQSAIDQLSKMLPKGENIMDSLGNISIATGGEK